MTNDTNPDLSPVQIPQSNALSEASADSLTELMDRDPLGLSRVQRDRQVAFYREQRARWEAVEASGGHKRAPSKAKKNAAAKVTDL